MRRFWCDCGHPLFFESTKCSYCEEAVGFDPVSFDMIRLQGRRTRSLFSTQGDYVYCQNGIAHQACNWALPAEQEGQLCSGCQFNRTIPDLSIEENLTRWRNFEAAKKRFLYTIMKLNLPLVDGFQQPERGLLFDFIEDARSNPVLLESFVSTGYLSGVITINALEADDVAREEQRLRMNESYRTLLGHLRHESGHYFQDYARQDDFFKQRFEALFGDADQDYQEALNRHYELGPAEGWQNYYISTYASCHPLEDWAECWSHYLHIADTLETAVAHNMMDESNISGDFHSKASAWRDFTVTLNELNRSMGLADAYPFVVNEWVEKKLAFVDEVVNRLSWSDPRGVVR